MIRTLKHSRRLFLHGIGGTAIAAPFLSSLAGRFATAQEEQTNPAKRLIVMFTHYGCMTNRWFPQNSHGALTADDLSGTSLEVLAPHVDKLLLPRGIRVMNEWTPDMSLGQGNDPDLQVVGTYFTCMPVAPHSDDPFSFETATKFNAKPTGPSLDHVCAQQLSSDGLPLFMRVSGSSDNTQSAISYSAADTSFAGVGNPSEAFSQVARLFGDAPLSHEELRRNALVDLVRDDLAALEGYDMSASDRNKLEVWKELLYETGAAVASALCNEQQATSLGLRDDDFEAFTSVVEGYDRVTNPITDSLDGADLFSNIAVLSALCDPSRVVFLKYPANYVYRGLGMTIESHSMANRIGNAGMGGPCVEDVNEMIMTIDRYYAAKFAHLVAQLDGIQEGEGTVLDNTAAVWFQQWSDGAAYNCNNMPILQAGSCGGYFKTGQAVNVEDGSPDLTGGNSEEACAVYGETDIQNIKGTGTPRDIANAPINKYYCNLMNAIGVKAGPDGYPAEGGTQEVTHYGMYDDTTDFISGGETPARIKDPGEFDALRA